MPSFTHTYDWMHGLMLHSVKVLDVEPLLNLTKLSYLDLWANDLSNMVPLSKMANLHRLELTENPIKFLGTLPPRLKYLHLEDCPVKCLANVYDPHFDIWELRVYDCYEIIDIPVRRNTPN